jgi:hypothetical protein
MSGNRRAVSVQESFAGLADSEGASCVHKSRDPAGLKNGNSDGLMEGERDRDGRAGHVAVLFALGCSSVSVYHLMCQDGECQNGSGKLLRRPVSRTYN